MNDGGSVERRFGAKLHNERRFNAGASPTSKAERS